MTLSYDESYQKGIRDVNSGLPSSPPSALPHVQEVYRIGRETAEKSSNK